MLKIYSYKGCSTCRSAVKWLKGQAISFHEVPIRENPPSIKELRAMLLAKQKDLRSLFNTSGQDYRALNIKKKLAGMSTDDALKLLSENGNLIKRPLALDQSKGIFLVGFKEEEWKKTFA